MVRYAASTAAAWRDAPAGAAASTQSGVYRPTIPFTASYTAPSTVAATRPEFGGGAFVATSDSTSVWFQSVTTSAEALAGADERGRCRSNGEGDTDAPRPPHCGLHNELLLDVVLPGQSPADDR